MKKAALLFAACLMAVALTACTGLGQQSSANSSAQTGSSVSSSASSPAASANTGKNASVSSAVSGKTASAAPADTSQKAAQDKELQGILNNVDSIGGLTNDLDKTSSSDLEIPNS